MAFLPVSIKAIYHGDYTLSTRIIIITKLFCLQTLIFLLSCVYSYLKGGIMNDKNILKALKERILYLGKNGKYKTVRGGASEFSRQSGYSRQFISLLLSDERVIPEKIIKMLGMK